MGISSPWSVCMDLLLTSFGCEEGDARGQHLSYLAKRKTIRKESGGAPVTPLQLHPSAWSQGGKGGGKSLARSSQGPLIDLVDLSPSSRPAERTCRGALRAGGQVCGLALARPGGPDPGAAAQGRAQGVRGRARRRSGTGARVNGLPLV